MISAHPNLIKKYNVKGSWYTEYPPMGLWNINFTGIEYKQALSGLSPASKSLLYIHFPFCPNLCYYCHCHTYITKDYDMVKKYLTLLFHEIELLSKFFEKNSINPNVTEIHLGGGSPTFLQEREFDLLIDKIGLIADMDNIYEFSIEIDPRNTQEDNLEFYSERGVNRISLGIQDFDLDVQKSVSRVQPFEKVEKLLSNRIREIFHNITFDIIYGLPRQSRESFNKTIDNVIQLSPDRIALFLFGYRPDIIKHQRLINESDLPNLYEKNMINFEAVDKLLSNNYIRVGIDHFVKPDDDISIARNENKICRNALGYTAGRFENILGIGTSSSSSLSNRYYFQNVYSLSEYEALLSNDSFPIYRGHLLTDDDIVRRDVIYNLISYFKINFHEISEKFNIDFSKYFYEELNSLDAFISDGFLEEVSDNLINITPLGEFYIRHVCAHFDAFTKQGKKYKHSKEFLKKK